MAEPVQASLDRPCPPLSGMPIQKRLELPEPEAMEVFRLPDGAFQAFDAEHGRDVQHGPGERRDRDPSPSRALVGQEPRVVPANRRRCAGRSRAAHLYPLARTGSPDPPERRCGTVAENSALACPQHRGEPPPLRRDDEVAHRIHPRVKGMEAARPQSAVDRAPAQTELPELGARHHTMLAPGKPGNHPVDRVSLRLPSACDGGCGLGWHRPSVAGSSARVARRTCRFSGRMCAPPKIFAGCGSRCACRATAPRRSRARARPPRARAARRPAPRRR